MKSRFIVSASMILLTVVLMAGTAMAWDEAKLRGEIQSLLDQVSAGMAKKDLAAVSATATPQAVIKYRNGQTMTMAQWREASAKDFADMQDIVSKFTVEQVWPKGKDQAGVVYKETHQFTRPSDPGHKHGISARFRALLTRTPQGWRFLEFTDLGIQSTRDGQPFYPKAKQPAAGAKTSK